jgi:hypothetical protein
MVIGAETGCCTAQAPASSGTDSALADWSCAHPRQDLGSQRAIAFFAPDKPLNGLVLRWFVTGQTRRSHKRGKCQACENNYHWRISLLFERLAAFKNKTGREPSIFPEFWRILLPKILRVRFPLILVAGNSCRALPVFSGARAWVGHFSQSHTTENLFYRIGQL